MNASYVLPVNGGWPRNRANVKYYLLWRTVFIRNMDCLQWCFYEFRMDGLLFIRLWGYRIFIICKQQYSTICKKYTLLLYTHISSATHPSGPVFLHNSIYIHVYSHGQYIGILCNVMRYLQNVLPPTYTILAKMYIGTMIKEIQILIRCIDKTHTMVIRMFYVAFHQITCCIVCVSLFQLHVKLVPIVSRIYFVWYRIR